MKKIVSLLLAAVMLITLSACSNKKSDEKPLPEDLSIKLENVWMTYLETESKLQGAVLWAYDFVTDYCEEPCRDNYARAVAATSAAADYIDTLTLGECLLTDSDYSELRNLGYDMSYISSDYSAFASDAETAALACRTMALDLMTESYWYYGIEYMKKNAQVHREIAEAQINIAAGKTNEIMLLAGKDGYTDAVYEKASSVIKRDTRFVTDFRKLDEESDRYLDAYEAAINRFSELESIQNANIYFFENAIKSGDYSQINAQAIIWDELYAVLNLPSFSVQKISAVYLDESGTRCTISPGDDLSLIEPIISIQFNGADKSSFIDYIVSIPVNSENYNVAGNLDGNGDCYVSYNDGVICFDALWKGSELTMTVYDNVSVLCPSWFVVYKLT